MRKRLALPVASVAILAALSLGVATAATSHTATHARAKAAHVRNAASVREDPSSQPDTDNIQLQEGPQQGGPDQSGQATQQSGADNPGESGEGTENGNDPPGGLQSTVDFQGDFQGEQ